MSNDETQSALSRAFELVENGNYDEARAILEPILETDKNNADAWWIYAHAATDPEVGREALENVLRINPTYPGAAELIAIARERYASPSAAAIPPASIPEAPPSLPEAENQPPDIPATSPTKATQETPAVATTRSGSSIVPLVAIAAVIVVVIVLLLLLSQGSGEPAATATPTEVAANVDATQPMVPAITEEATLEVIPAMTEAATDAVEAPTRAPTITPTFTLEPGATEPLVAESADVGTLAAILSQFPLTDDGVQTVETSLGSTVQANVCSTPGREMRTLLPQVMNTLARESGSLGADVQAIAVHIVNCADNSDLLSVGVERASAQSYADGNLNDGEFAALWQPL